MINTDKGFNEMFNHNDLILICDVHGKIMFYEDYNDQINMLKSEKAIGRSVFDLYPFFKREDFTLFKAIDTKRPVVNELQQFEVNGVPKKALNSAYPLMNECGIIGCLVMSVELDNKQGKRKHSAVTAKYNFSDIITQNKKFLASFEKLTKLAQSDSNILIYGETGTGKELFAHTIHANSARCNSPFIIQNCAAIPGNLMESILFGSAKGSFTGAIDKPGLFEVASGGTLFLDEINSISLELQSKLLRAIETRSIRRVGESYERETDVRILASSNEPLAKKVEKGEFRKDLFYRLNVASFSIPPLRERMDDIPLLCQYYIDYYNGIYNHDIIGLDKDVQGLFSRYHWDGNVRELKNILEYACIIKQQGYITLNDIPDYVLSQAKHREASPLSAESAAAPAALSSSYIKEGATLQSQIESLEIDILSAALKRNRYSITKTAKELNISRQTLYNKLSKYNLL
ncbi:sigma 54-interacting transcriptional regulator [Anaerovoracaceae bacterium 42-11]